MIYLIVLILIVCTSSSSFILSSNVKISSFNKLPEDVLRHISEFTKNPFIMKSLNKAANKAIPSAQAVISKKFNSLHFQSLPHTPELWHILDFHGNLMDFIKDSERFLPKSFPIIAETIVIKLADGSLELSSQQLKQFKEALKKNYLPHLLPDPNIPIAYYQFIIQNLIYPVEEQVRLIEELQLSPNDLFIALLEAIKKVSYFEGCLDRLKQLIGGLSHVLNSSDYVRILNTLLNLKFDSFSFDSFEIFELMKDTENVDEWRDYFSLIAIEVLKYDVLPMTLYPIKYPVSQEIQQALLKSPELLLKFNKYEAQQIFSTDNLITYRVNTEPDDFDIRKLIITYEDVIVSGYIHTPERFSQVLSRFSCSDFRHVTDIFSYFLQDPALISNLLVISEFMETAQNFPEVILPEISFLVLDFVILYNEHFNGLLENSFNLFKIIVPPKVMARVLRDNQLYSIIKENPKRFFNRFYFSCIDAIRLFTEFDWKRLFALSKVPFNFNYHKNSSSLRMALTPFNCIPLSDTLDLIKYNLVNFFLINTSIKQLKSSPEEALLYGPLLSIWAENDIKSYNQYFN